MSAFKSLTFFVSFLLILGVVSYGNRDYHQYLMGKEVKAIFPLVEEASSYFHHDFLRYLALSFTCSCKPLAGTTQKMHFNQ